jgi:hypothetical protein
MAHQVLKPYSLLLYFLSFIAFFFVGASIAGLIGAAKNQGLAGGAIVFGYAVIAAFIAFIIAIVIASKVNRKLIVNLNKILAILIVVFFSYFAIKYQTQQKKKQELDNPKIEKSKVPTKTTEPIAMLHLNSENEVAKTKLTGLGMFAPNIYENKVLYFYANINYEKALNEHMPIDSITFKRDKYHNILIATAPPWLMPEHLKLDYGILYFKIKSVFREFVEVEVNTTNGQSSYASTESGTIMYWPKFFLSVNSVEFLEPKAQTVYVRPFNLAGTVNADYSFMRTLKIQNQWMYVELLTDDFKKVGKGWIQWRKDGKLLITYSLLS